MQAQIRLWDVMFYLRPEFEDGWATEIANAVKMARATEVKADVVEPSGEA